MSKLKKIFDNKKLGKKVNKDAERKMLDLNARNVACRKGNDDDKDFCCGKAKKSTKAVKPGKLTEKGVKKGENGTGKVVETPTDPFEFFQTKAVDKRTAAEKRNKVPIAKLVAEKRIVKQELDRCKNNMDKKLQ